MSRFREWSGYFNSIINQFGQDDVFIRFMILWVSYNSYYNSLRETEPGLFITQDEKTKDSEKAIIIYKKDKLRQFYESQHERIVSEFKRIPSFNGNGLRDCVVDTRYNDINSTRNAKYPQNENNLKYFLKAVYQIRCNLFHGNKTPYSETDKQLTEWAYKNLLIILNELNYDLFRE